MQSRTASCQHQRVSPCEGQDKILFNVNVTANFVGLNTELCKKRVCELEEKQWRTDRDESGSESMTEYVAPAPAVYSATPAPPIEFVTPSPVIEYSAPAPPVTCFSPSPQFPTMADLITGVTTSVDDVCPRPRSCTEHCDLTADDSQDECLADGMPSYEMACPCRTSTPHRVMIGCTAVDGLSVDERAMRGTPLKSTRRTGLQPGGSCKSWAAGSVSLWSGPTTSKLKEAPWKRNDLSTGSYWARWRYTRRISTVLS